MLPQINSTLSRAIADALESSWAARARPSQLPPPGDWTTWLLMAGRGFGKSLAGANWVVDQVIKGTASRIAIAGATAADVRDVMVEGPSGILAASPSWCRPLYEPSKRRLTWPNGAIGITLSADKPERFRGPNFDAAWCDELAAWSHPDSFDMLMFALRIGKNPRCVVTTTPRPIRLIRELANDPTCVVTRGSTYENRSNLAPAFFAQIIRRFEGTRLGRQELEAELLEDIPGALWTQGRIDDLRCTAMLPPMRRIVVAVDPSGGEGEGHDEVGIIVAGVGNDDHGYVLADASGSYSPDGWARAAVTLFQTWGADRVVAEVNYGGAMVESVLRQVDPNIPFSSVHASRGKVARAEPAAALYEQGRVHHAGMFKELETELTGFTTSGYVGGGSPNRADALVWAISELMVTPMASWGIFEFTRRLAEGDPIVLTQSLADVYAEAGRRLAAGKSPFGDPADPHYPPVAPDLIHQDDIEGERERFRVMLCGRQPTANEICEHERKLRALHDAQGGMTSEYRRRQAMLAGLTPAHPDIKGGAVEYVNGARARLTYAPGSLEFLREQAESK